MKIEALAGYLARNKSHRRASVLSTDVGDVNHYDKIDPSDFITLFFVMRSKKTVSNGRLPSCDFKLDLISTGGGGGGSTIGGSSVYSSKRSQSRDGGLISRQRQTISRGRHGGSSVVSSMASVGASTRGYREQF